jgi:uncharacterized membrane protein YidH (DUF202 family)
MPQKYANNPQAVVNGFYSASRNVFLMSSIGIAMYGFSGTFKITQSESMIKIFSIGIFIICTLYGLNIGYSFHKYIKLLEEDIPNLPNYVDIPYMKNALYITIGYIIMVLIIIVLTMLRLINRIK